MEKQMDSQFTTTEIVGETFPKGLLRVLFNGDRNLLYPGENGIGVVCIHGHGSHEDQIFTGKNWPDLTALKQKLLREGFGILSPNLFGNLWMAPKAVDTLAALIAHCRGKYGWRKIILDSGSMGASSNLVFAMLHPELVDAVCGSGQVTDLARYVRWCDSTAPDSPCHGIAAAIREAYGHSLPLMEAHSAFLHVERLNMPLFLSHGALDAIIPVAESRALVGKLAEKKDLLFREIPNGDHDSSLCHLSEHLDLALKGELCSAC